MFKQWLIFAGCPVVCGQYKAMYYLTSTYVYLKDTLPIRNPGQHTTTFSTSRVARGVIVQGSQVIPRRK